MSILTQKRSLGVINRSRYISYIVLRILKCIYGVMSWFRITEHWGKKLNMFMSCMPCSHRVSLNVRLNDT